MGGPSSGKKTNCTQIFCFHADKCANDTDCPVGATCQSNNCYYKDDLCNSKSLSQCVKLLTLDEECIGKHVTVYHIQKLTVNVYVGKELS